MLLAVRTLFFFVLITGCGRTGFDGQPRDSVPAAGLPISDGDDACGSLGSLGAPVELTPPPNKTIVGPILSHGPRFVMAGWSSLSATHSTGTVLAYQDETDTWDILDVYDRGDGHTIQSGNLAVTSSALFYTGNDTHDATVTWFIRASLNDGTTWTTVATSTDTALSADIVTPSDQTIIAASSYNSATKGGFTVTRTNDGGDSWAEVDGPHTGDTATALADLPGNVFALGHRDTATSSAWVAYTSNDPNGDVWTARGPWFESPGVNIAALGFAIPNVEGVFIAGTIAGPTGGIGRIAHIGNDWSATAVDDVSVVNQDVSVSSRYLLHSSGCTLVFAQSGDSASNTRRVHVRGSDDGATWSDFSPPESLSALKSAVELGSGDLLASVNLTSGFATLVRIPVNLR